MMKVDEYASNCLTRKQAKKYIDGKNVEQLYEKKIEDKTVLRIITFDDKSRIYMRLSKTDLRYSMFDNLFSPEERDTHGWEQILPLPTLASIRMGEKKC